MDEPEGQSLSLPIFKLRKSTAFRVFRIADLQHTFKVVACSSCLAPEI